MEEIKSLLKDLLREDHDILLKVSQQTEAIVKNHEDHEKRIRILERVLMYGVGAAGAMKWVSEMIRK